MASRFENAPVVAGETITAGWSWWKRARRAVPMAVCTVSDTALGRMLGLTPLETHVLVCGYPRGGTTMLLAMLEYGYPTARKFGEEISGWRAATFKWRNHAMLISKVPKDLLVVHRVMNWYRGRAAKLKTIIVLRDPRDVLTSHHVSHDRPYFQEPEEWRLFHSRYEYHRSNPEVLTVKYEDLVDDVPGTQATIEAFIGVKSERPFADFHKAERSDFDTRPLNGVRPADKKSVGRWARAEHAGRIEQILREVPDFPELLIEMGYEQDRAWIDRWRAGVGEAAK